MLSAPIRFDSPHQSVSGTHTFDALSHRYALPISVRQYASPGWTVLGDEDPPQGSPPEDERHRP